MAVDSFSCQQTSATREKSLVALACSPVVLVCRSPFWPSLLAHTYVPCLRPLHSVRGGNRKSGRKFIKVKHLLESVEH